MNPPIETPDWLNLLVIRLGAKAVPL
eukprot:COSAG01_NODE_26620_length_708_cov_0.706076_2_plen_25_part_01